MSISTSVPNVKSKFVLFWARSKRQISESDIHRFKILKSVRIYLFCTAQNTTNLKSKTCDFFRVFWKLKNVNFHFFKNTELPGAREPKHRTPLEYPYCTWKPQMDPKLHVTSYFEKIKIDIVC